MRNTVGTVTMVGAVVLTMAARSALGQSASTLTEGAKWESSVTFGFTMTQGNSESLLASLNFVSTKKWAKNEISASASMAYGENDGRRNSDNQRAGVQYNRLLSNKSFYYLRTDAMRDPIAEVDYRVTFSPGGGYYFWKDAKKGFFRAELGPGYIYENKGGTTQDHFTLRAAERFEYKLNDNVKMWHSMEYLPDVDNFSDFRIVAEVGADVKLMKNLTLRSFINDSFDNAPPANRKANDLRFVTQIGFKF